MKHLRAAARITGEQVPALYDLLANSEQISEARMLDVNTTLEGVETLLFEIYGDPTALEERADEMAGIESVDVSRHGDERAYALVVLRPLETPLFQALHRRGPHAGLVIRTPIIYGDGRIAGRAVGDPEALQRVLDDTPDTFDIRVDEISRYQGGLDNPETTLSDRQREALETAHELGYYEQPRRATHEEIADELGCSAVTASDHLQKAEAKLVDAAVDEMGQDI